MSDDEADDADIYENLPNFFLDETYKNLEDEKKELKIKVEELGKQLDEIRKENDKLATKVKALGKNISCLYKTAIRELERKDQIIADLRKERDDLLFRRGMNSTAAPRTTRSNRKQLTPTKKVRNGDIKRPDHKVKTNTSKQEDLSSVAKAVETVEPKPPKEKTPEKIIPAVETVEVKETPLQSESKPEENPKAESNSKEETILENSISEKTPANVSNIQILSGSEDSFVQTPASDKFTSHATTEDCGFGRRRKVRRIIRSTTSSASSTPVRILDTEANLSQELQPPSAKRICVEADLSSTTFNTSADKSSTSTPNMEVAAKNNGNAMEESACEKVSEDGASSSGNSVSKDPSVPQRDSDSVLPSQARLEEEVEKGGQPEHTESDPRKEDSVVSESCEIDLKVSSTDDQSTNSGNLSIRSQSDCSSLTPINHTTVEMKTRTTTYVEEYSVSSIEFDNKRGSGGSSTPKSDRVPYPESDVSPGERGKRPRSWERERIDQSSPIQNQERRMRHSARDSHRERDHRDSHYGRDYRSRVTSSGGDRTRRMERDPRGDRNYRCRGRDHGDDRSHGPDSMRHRDEDVRRDSGRRRRTRSRERRNDSFHGSSNRNRDSERSGHLSRDRREMEERDRSGSRGRNRADIHNKSDRSPKPVGLQNDEHLRSNCIPPTEWD